jgi:hypothetical protein
MGGAKGRKDRINGRYKKNPDHVVRERSRFIFSVISWMRFSSLIYSKLVGAYLLDEWYNSKKINDLKGENDGA